jgi:hypothetical protein
MARRINVGGPNNVLTWLFEKAFIAYMRSVYLQKNKDIFKVHELPAEEFAQSIGLPGAPKIKFVKASAKASAAKEAQRVEAMAKLTVATKANDGEESSSEEESEPEESVLQAKVGKKATPWREAIKEQSSFNEQHILLCRYPSQLQRSKRCSSGRIRIFSLNTITSSLISKTKIIFWIAKSKVKQMMSSSPLNVVITSWNQMRKPSLCCPRPSDSSSLPRRILPRSNPEERELYSMTRAK